MNPEAIKQYMFGTNVVSAWREGTPIVWKGEWQGKSHKDKGVILRIKPGQILQYTHFSSLSGLPDRPERYHTVTIELSADGHQTRLSLAQDNNSTEDARAFRKELGDDARYSEEVLGTIDSPCTKGLEAIKRCWNISCRGAWRKLIH
ncbi:MAG: SRPBCC domain-containing protein [Nitrospiraceae bacterium]